MLHCYILPFVDMIRILLLWADLPPPNTIKLEFFKMPLKSKVFIQTLQKSQERHKISFAFEFNNKNTKKVFGHICPRPPPTQLSWIYPPLQLGLNLPLQMFDLL